ncbi:MAG: hypothetical protein ACOWWM_16155 [Desulfobacterales bacterium]
MNDPLSTESRIVSGPESRLHCDETSSAEELEKCAEATRQNVDRTMQKVEERLAPGRLYDDAWHFLRQSLADARNQSGSLDEAVSHNPALFAAMGIGLALLGGSIAGYAFKKMTEKDTSPSRHRARWYETEPHDIPRAEWKPGAVTPPSAAVSPDTRLEHEASTEEFQRDILTSAERRTKDASIDDEKVAHSEEHEEFASHKPRHF